MSPIPIKKIPINLTKDTPSKVTAEELKKELNAIGLTCGETHVEKLEQYIEETVSTFADGKTQGYGIFKFSSPEINELYEKGYTSKSISDLPEKNQPSNTRKVTLRLTPSRNSLQRLL